MIFGWLRKEGAKKYDWSRFVANDENPVEFLTDLVVAILTLASFEYQTTEVNLSVLRQTFWQLCQEFHFPVAEAISDDCGYPQQPEILDVAITLSRSRGIEVVDADKWGVPNWALQRNLWYLRKRGPGFIKELYPVVDRFIGLVTEQGRRYVATH